MFSRLFRRGVGRSRNISNFSKPPSILTRSSLCLSIIYYLFLKLPTRENSVSLPVVSSGVATLNSSEELSYKYLVLLLHSYFRNIFAFLVWNNFAWKERKGSCSVHLLTNRESLDLNSQGEIFLDSMERR